VLWYTKLLQEIFFDVAGERHLRVVELSLKVDEGWRKWTQLWRVLVPMTLNFELVDEPEGVNRYRGS